MMKKVTPNKKTEWTVLNVKQLIKVKGGGMGDQGTGSDLTIRQIKTSLLS